MVKVLKLSQEFQAFQKTAKTSEILSGVFVYELMEWTS